MVSILSLLINRFGQIFGTVKPCTLRAHIFKRNRISDNYGNVDVTIYDNN